MSRTQVTKVHPWLPADWDTLTGGDDLYVSAPWFASQAAGFTELGGLAATVSGGDGTLLAGLPMFPLQDDDPVMPWIHPARLLAMYFPERPPDTSRLMPSLLCGGRQSTATRALIDARLPEPDRARLLAELISAAVRHAQDLSLSSVAFLYVDEHDRLFRGALRDAGFTETFSGDDFHLDIEWPDLAGYVESRSRHRRHRIRQDLRRLAEGGVRLETTGLGNVPLDRLADLAAQRMAKYGREVDHRATVADLERLHQTFGERARLFLAWLGDQVAGYALLLQWRQHLYPRITGFDYGLQGSLPLYFAVGYYEPVAYATEHSIATIHYGPTAEEAKTLRGCRRVRQYGYYLAVDDEVNDWLRAQVSAR